jgi:hypothetical protein
MELASWFAKMLEEPDEDYVDDPAAVDDLRDRVAKAFAEWRVTWASQFKFLLRLEDGEPNEPAALLTAVPNWDIGQTFMTARGDVWHILAIDTEIDDELVEQGFNAVFTVESA